MDKNRFSARPHQLNHQANFFSQALEHLGFALVGWSGHDLQNLFFLLCFPQQVSLTFCFERPHGVTHPVWQRFSAISTTDFEELNTLSICTPQ